MDPTLTTITVRLPRSLKDSITAAAKREDLTASQYVRRFISAHSKPAGKSNRKGLTV